MMIQEDEVCYQINQRLTLAGSSNTKSFTDEEVGICITQLCEQNKAMKSDGFVYGI